MSWLDAWRARLAGPGVFPRRRLQFVYRRRYRFDLPGGSQDSRRAARILSYLASRPFLRRWQVHRPRPATLGELGRVHTEAYLDSLQEPGALTPILGFELPDLRQDEFLDHQREMVGGTLLSAQLALGRGGLAVNLGGGFHHATADRGQGFCAFNDVAVAIAHCRADGFDGPVLVLDLDLHDGEGTRSIFADDTTIHTFSIHNRDLGSPDGVETTSVNLGSGVGDDPYHDEIRERIPALLDRFAPQLVFYVAGCDVAIDDPLGNWNISPAGLLARDQAVLLELSRRDLPGVIVLAGGYGNEAWRHTARTLDWLLSGESSPPDPPHTLDLTLTRMRRLSRMLPSARLSAEPTEQDWSPTAEELFGDLTLGPTRLLGFYSRHGVELALERYGVLSHMRSLGFDNLSVEFDLGGTTGQTVRVLNRGGAPELLMELRVRRDAGTVPGADLLAVEWLLLQNPRASFTAERPMLPGQRAPGLGLLREITSILVLACERLHLDGILLTPSQYHIAAQTEARFHFLHPEDEARFLGLREALRGLRLDEAIQLLDLGRVVRRGTGRNRSVAARPDHPPRLGEDARPVAVTRTTEGGAGPAGEFRFCHRRTAAGVVAWKSRQWRTDHVFLGDGRCNRRADAYLLVTQSHRRTGSVKPKFRSEVAMSFSSRIFGMIEMEISRQLSFSLALLETAQTLGVDPRRFRTGDALRFTVTARNDADFKIRSIRGSIAPSRIVRFRPVNFMLAELAPGTQAVVATIDAQLMSLPERGSWVDQVASISLSAGADLSNLLFQEWEKPVIYVTRSGQAPARGPGVVTVGSSRTQAGEIPLSGIPLSEIL